jgi:hypothetical protein
VTFSAVVEHHPDFDSSIYVYAGVLSMAIATRKAVDEKFT